MRVLGIFAHPDDETILIGGTLAMLTSHGAELHILSATRGEGGELGEPPLAKRHQLGDIRAAELHCAVQALGGHDVSFLGYEDPTIDVGEEGLAFEADPAILRAEIQAQISNFDPDAVITHGSNGEYGHPAHVFIHQSVLAAAQGSACCVYGISAQFERHPRPRLANQDDPAHLVLDIEPWIDQKIAAARCHRTQKALFVRRSSQKAGRRLDLEQVLMRQESLHRFQPQNSEAIHDPLSQFIQSRCGRALLYVDPDVIKG
ncbi:MAG: PIG-L deacetylase family protein [Anaerolineales bacterium]|jgi:LmbE family N-acetylglucosaminyl deacetylase